MVLQNIWLRRHYFVLHVLLFCFCVFFFLFFFLFVSDKLSKQKKNKQKKGACVECCQEKCYRYYHVSCAMERGVMNIVSFCSLCFCFETFLLGFRNECPRFVYDFFVCCFFFVVVRLTLNTSQMKISKILYSQCVLNIHKYGARKNPRLPND